MSLSPRANCVRGAAECLTFFSRLDALVVSAVRHRLASCLYTEFRHNPSGKGVEILERLKPLHQRNTLKMLRFTTELTRIGKLFKQYNIPMLTFKGPLLSLQLYGDINQRECKDLDIFVPEKDIDKAQHLLEQDGYQINYPDTKLSPKQWRIYKARAKDISFYHPEKKVCIELHWHWFRTKHFFTVSNADVWATAIDAKLANTTVKTLSPEYNFLYLCAHGNAHSWRRLCWLHDIATLIEQDNDWQWSALLEKAEALKVKRVFVEAILLSHEIFKTQLPSEIQREISRDKTVRILAKLSKHIIKHDSARPVRVLRKALSNPSWRYKLAFLCPKSFELLIGLWKRYPLPDRLFSLYYILLPVDLVFRPVCLLFRKLRT